MENRLERHPCIDFSAPFFDALIGLLPRLAEMAYDDPIGFPVRYIETVMNHILLLHSAPLDSVRFDIPYQGDHNDLVQGILNKVSIEQSINRAAMKEVKRVAIHRKGTWRSRLPPSLLACNLLRVLEIEGFQFRQIPRNFRGFMFLKACSFCEVTDLTDERLQQLIALCPLLEKLKVKRCVGLSNLHTRAPNLIYLYLGACSMEEITSHCPLLVELIMKNCMTLCKMELNSSQFLQEMEELDPSSLEMIPALQCLNKLSLRIGLEIPFGVLISTFPDLEELKITDILIQNMMAGEWASNNAFPNLKEVYVYISSAIWGEREEALLGFLCSNAPKLNSLVFCHAPIGKRLCSITDRQFANWQQD